MSTASAEFEDFFRRVEPKVRTALSADFGFELGHEATAEAMRYGWEHWARVSQSDNPAGYVFRVGQRLALREKRRASRWVVLRDRRDPSAGVPWVEPKLSAALSALTSRQRISVVLVHGLGWTYPEVGELLSLAPTTVQSHAARGLSRLQRTLEVAS